MALRFPLFVSTVIFWGSVADGQGNCKINGAMYSYCQVGWTEWTACSSSCRSDGLIRNIIVCCPPNIGTIMNVTKEMCFSHCNVSKTVMSKMSGKVSINIKVMFLYMNIAPTCKYQRLICCPRTIPCLISTSQQNCNGSFWRKFNEITVAWITSIATCSKIMYTTNILSNPFYILPHCVRPKLYST